VLETWTLGRREEAVEVRLEERREKLEAVLHPVF